MEPNCLSCRNAFRFFDGACDCFLEPCGKKRHKDDYLCERHEFVDETVYDERVAWKQRELSQFLLEKVNEIYNQSDYDKNKYRFIRLDWLENNKEFLGNDKI